MKFNLQSVKKIIDHCDDDGRKLDEFDSSALLFTIKQMFHELNTRENTSMNQHPSNHTNGCKLHMVTDCGCPGYPSLQNVLRDCGNNCGDYRQQDRCIRCQAAAMIDRYKTRSERYLERILHLQETVDRYEHIRDITTQAWATQPPSWEQN